MKHPLSMIYTLMTMELNSYQIHRGNPLQLNSHLFEINDTSTYFTIFRKNTRNTPKGTGYFSFHWLAHHTNNFDEITRDYFYFENKYSFCFFWSQPPPGATHLVFGVRINCEEANVSPDSFTVSFQDMLLTKPIMIPRQCYAIYKTLKKSFSITPITINVELISFCNLRCIWCILDHKKPKITMSFELFQQIIDQIIKHRKIIRRVDLHNGGEVLLHPDIQDFLYSIGNSKKKIPDFPYTALLTNATKLTPELTMAIIDSKSLDLIRFSFDGGTPDEYNRIRKGADFYTTYANIKKFLELNNVHANKIFTGIICIIDHKYPLSTEWMDNFFKDIISRVDFVELRRPHNFDGSINLGVNRGITRNGLCQYVKNNNIVILPNGDLTICCIDLNDRGVIGNIHTTDLLESLNCKKRRSVIDAMENNERKTVKLCENCDIH